VRIPDRKERHFAGKVHAFNVGYAAVKDLDYEVIGNLDADISFEIDYFSFLLSKFAENPQLGVGGTPFREGSHQYDYRFTSIEHVSGACQLFRRECFESIGGYAPVKDGGIDLIAVVTARMKGWQTRTFTERVCAHHRRMGAAKHNSMMYGFRTGEKDYALGGHPVWELFRAIYQTSKRPFVIGGLMILAGYFCSMVRHAEKPVSIEFVKFRRREQMKRVKRFVTDRRPGWI